MAKKTPKLTLLVGSSSTGLQPPRNLGQPGRALWDSVMDEYDIRDSAGIELLALAAQALDRAESCRAVIDEDGELLFSKAGPKEHPLLKAEISNRSFVARTLQRLGLNLEPIKPVGRPPGS